MVPISFLLFHLFNHRISILHLYLYIYLTHLSLALYHYLSLPFARSNGRFLSTRHRVLNKKGVERFSMPFFFEPNFHCRVACLPTCCSPQNPAKYAPVEAGEYLLSRYAATHEAYGGPSHAQTTSNERAD